MGATGDAAGSGHAGAPVRSGAPCRADGDGDGGEVPWGHRFVEAGTHRRRCEKLDGRYTAARAAELYYLANASASLHAALGGWMSNDAMERKASRCTRSVIEYGLPLEPPEESHPAYAEFGDSRWGSWQRAVREQMGAMSDRLFDHFGVPPGHFQRSRWRNWEAAAAANPELEVRWYTYDLYYDEGMGLLSSDTVMVALSALFVFLYISWHARSLVLGVFGVLMILLSMPLALLIYPFTFIREHLIAIFLALGIGADDLFVFLDAWRQSSRATAVASYTEAQAAAAAATASSDRATLEARMASTLSRTASTVLATSLTTAMSFVGTALSPLFPIASLGVYAAFIVSVMYVLSISWWPCAVLIHELYIAPFPHCRRTLEEARLPRRSSSAEPIVPAATIAAAATAAAAHPSPTPRPLPSSTELVARRAEARDRGNSGSFRRSADELPTVEADESGTDTFRANGPDGGAGSGGTAPRSWRCAAPRASPRRDDRRRWRGAKFEAVVPPGVPAGATFGVQLPRGAILDPRRRAAAGAVAAAVAANVAPSVAPAAAPEAEVEEAPEPEVAEAEPPQTVRVTVVVPPSARAGGAAKLNIVPGQPPIEFTWPAPLVPQSPLVIDLVPGQPPRPHPQQLEPDRPPPPRRHRRPRTTRCVRPRTRRCSTRQRAVELSSGRGRRRRRRPARARGRCDEKGACPPR